ncbi:MAG: prepilin peptidase, partial [Candidatus Uhrbacteria bacterium]
MLTTLLGLILGSFANVLIDRVPAGQSVRGRSRCERCRRTLVWWELIPVLSALALRHRCRTCGERFSSRLTAVELGSVALLLLVLWRFGWIVTSEGVLAALGLWVLGILAIIDLQYGIVPDIISLPAIFFLLVIKILLITHYSLLITQLIPSVIVGALWFAIQR